MSLVSQRAVRVDGPAHSVSPLALVAAGVLFVLYPVMRGFGPEEGLHGAESFATWKWSAAHMCAMAGFVLVAVALRFLQGWGGRVELTGWLAASFLLPYYGAEAFALTAAGEWARDNHDYGVLAIADGFRYGVAPMTTFAIGWILLAAVGVVVIVRATRASSGWTTATRCAAALSGVGLVVFLPMFFVPGSLRIVHGMVLGFTLIAWGTGVFVANRAADT